ncbi:MAG TPA: glycosyl hydrolase family 18 protein [Puia sp.]|nr:glycosyl hydrolase family 18 protein [Puia sp.]
MKNMIPGMMQLIVLAALSLLTVCNKAGKGNGPETDAGKDNQFRTVGYLMINRADLAAAMTTIDWHKLTHLNLAFVNPDSTGVFTINPGLAAVVQTAHDNQVKVLMSLGGGSMPPWMNGLLTDSRRAAFIEAIVKVVDGYALDGVDVDLEGSNIDGHYASFVSELSAALTPGKKLMTAAVATWSGDGVPDEALSRYDFINIMSYDKTGPWDPSVAGPHAPYDMAVSDLAYWGGRRKVPKEKLVLGLPFYGYGFGPGPVASTMSYRDIVDAYPGAADKDQVMMVDGETMYYNGISTIKSKTALALQEAGGVMIWELTQDAQGQGSLLKHINEVITQH